MEPNVEQRALAAYQRARFHDLRFPYLDPLAPGVSRVVELEGKRYVLLSNGTRDVAVYRIGNDGILRRLRRPPKNLA